MSSAHLQRDKWVATAILAATLGFYGYCVMDVIANARTWVDEVTYLIKSWQYVTGQVEPYTDQDPTWYMPLYFYELGFWQKLIGTGIAQGRYLSAGLGAISGLLVFDVVRRITGDVIGAALAAAILLTLPAVTFYFGTATPIATVSLLVLLTVWLAISGLGKSSLWRSIGLGALFATLYFYRQNMILIVVAVAPVYLLGLRQSRFIHMVMVLVGILLIVAPVIMVFPDRLVSYAIRLPLITPALTDLNFMADPLVLIEANTVGTMGLGLALSKFDWRDVFDAFLLPYAGLILAAGTVFVLTSRKLRVLWIAPIIFVFLAVTHYVGSLDYCQTCILPYTASFAGIGAICAGIAIALISYAAKKDFLPGGILKFGFAAVVISLGQTASGLATRSDYRFYPSAMLTNTRAISEREETTQLATFLRDNTPAGEAILPIHDMITIPHALFLAERTFPVQGLNLRHSYRLIRSNLSDSERSAILDVIGREGLWTDELLENWIQTEYDTVVFQVDPRGRNSSLEARIQRDFDRTASTGFRGWNVHVYQRKSVGDDVSNELTP